MKKIIVICLIMSLLILGCSKEEKQEEQVTMNEVEVTITGISENQKVILLTEDTEQSVNNNETVKILENTMFSLKIADEKKTWTVTNLIALPNTKIDVSSYKFGLSEIEQLISTYGLEHTRAMAWKDMTQWTSITDNFLMNAQGDYMNETLYEGQLKHIDLDLNSLQMTNTNALTFQAELQFEERYYLTEEVESLHKGHSHGEDSTSTETIAPHKYTIVFSLVKLEDGWKVDQIDFSTSSLNSANLMSLDVEAPFFTPTNEAIELAQYHLEYKQISIFLEEFFTEYVKALNFKNIDYISTYTKGETIFHKKITEQADSDFVELLDINIISMDKQSENLFKWNVELLLQKNGQEMLEKYDFHVSKNDHNYYIMAE